MCVVLATSPNRALTPAERRLALWMLENGNPDARRFLDQLDRAEVTPWRCACGCASINFQIQGCSEAPAALHILGDFVFGDEDDPMSLCGIFIFESNGVLRGIDVYGFASNAPGILPTTNMLRPAVFART